MTQPPGTTPPPRARRQVVDSAVLGTLIFVVTETMFFVGFISAFTITRANAMPGMWPPPGQPRLEPGATALNTVLLVLSGLVLLAGNLVYRRATREGGTGRGSAAQWLMLAAWALGAAFVGLQGAEWAALLSAGMTFRSSPMGAFFHLIVGGHALHAIAALLFLGIAWVKLARGKLTRGFFFGTQTFWYFVVLMWPVIYARVYF